MKLHQKYLQVKNVLNIEQSKKEEQKQNLNLAEVRKF